MKGSKNKIHGKVGKGKIVGDVSGDPNEKGMTKAEVEAYRAGKRRDGTVVLTKDSNKNELHTTKVTKVTAFNNIRCILLEIQNLHLKANS